MKRILSTFIFGMATMTLIAFSMTVFGQTEGVAADCQLRAFDVRDRLFFDTGLVREKLSTQSSEILLSKQREIRSNLYHLAVFRASVGRELTVAYHVGKNSEIAAKNKLASATGNAATPVELEQQFNASGVTLKVSCQVVK